MMHVYLPAPLVTGEAVERTPETKEPRHDLHHERGSLLLDAGLLPSLVRKAQHHLFMTLRALAAP